MRVWKKLRKWSVIYSLKKELGPAERHIKSIENLPFYNVEISSSNKDVLQIRLLLKMESLRIVGSELKCQNFKLSPKYLFQFVKQTTFDLIQMYVEDMKLYRFHWVLWRWILYIVLLYNLSINIWFCKYKCRLKNKRHKKLSLFKSLPNDG